MDPVAATIQQPWVRIPNGATTLYKFIQLQLVVICYWIMKMTKINYKETGIVLFEK